MSGLGSGMPQGVTMVTPVTVNFWAHVTRPHEWRISVDGGENLCEEKKSSDWERHVSCVDSFRLLTTSVRVVWKVETRLFNSIQKKVLLFWCLIFPICFRVQPWLCHLYELTWLSMVHCHLCNNCYTLSMPGPRPDIRCVQYLPKVP